MSVSDDVRLPPYINVRCREPDLERAEADNDEAWLAQQRRYAPHATALRNTLADILSTAPGTLEHEHAKVRGQTVLRRIELQRVRP